MSIPETKVLAIASHVWCLRSMPFTFSLHPGSFPSASVAGIVSPLRSESGPSTSRSSAMSFSVLALLIIPFD